MIDSAESLKQRPAVAVETVMIGTSVVVTPMKPTLTASAPVPIVSIWYGASAKSGFSQPAAEHSPAPFLTMFAVT